MENNLQRRTSDTSTLPPDYDSTRNTYELARLTPSSSSQTSLPLYETVYGEAGASSNQTGFYPAKLLQIQADGFPLIAFPLPPRPDPIHIFGVSSVTGEFEELEYTSFRPARSSGDCFLVKGNDPLQPPLCTTTYRFGPGRPPKIQLLGSIDAAAASPEETPDYNEEITVKDKSCISRTTVMRTHLGTFEWRYASRAERKALGADNVLILDQVTTVALAGGKQETRRQKIAQFLRNAEFRTEGSRRTTAGNGGRLMMDLRGWTDRKGEAGQMEVLVLASIVLMLKKEVDRRRMHQMIAMSSGGGGGGG